MIAGTDIAGGEPRMLGPFRIVATLGTGASSTVYLGERVEGFAQRVAIKLLHPVIEAASEEREQQLLSSLEDANIVRLLDQGTSSSGQRYLVMEYVAGQPIDQHCDLHRLTIAQRGALLVKAMAGVSYAHRHLIVHADLKPANILVTEEGEAKLLDFGISSLLAEAASRSSTAMTFYTPDFASPEQRRNEPVTVATDIYALGVLAFLIFTGSLPFAGDSSLSDDKEAVPTASSVLKKMSGEERKRIAESRSMNIASLTHSIQGDLDAVLQKALALDPAQRYPTVDAFRSDLISYLAGKPVTARAATAQERARKWMRRHRWLAASAAALAAIVLASTIGVVVQAQRAAKQRSMAQSRLHDLVRLTGVLDGELYESVTPLQHSDAARDSLIRNVEATLDKLASGNTGDPELSVQLAQQYAKLARLQLAENPADKTLRSRALADIDMGIGVLNHDSAEATGNDAQRTLADLKALKQSIGPL
jgi:hypothetical protein